MKKLKYLIVLLVVISGLSSCMVESRGYYRGRPHHYHHHGYYHRY